MSDLREDLAGKLWKEWEGLGLATGELAMHRFERVADECIRQMEWAAANGFNHCCSRGLHNPLDPLTLAPEDWKP